MKFTDGYWQIRPGMTPHYVAQVHDVEINNDALTVYAPTKKLQGRGDTLNLPLLTVQYSSPMENVISVKIIHHKGGQTCKPEFEMNHKLDLPVATSNDENCATLTSGDLSVRVNKGEDWLAEFIGGDKVLTSSGWRAVGFVDTWMTCWYSLGRV